MHPVPEGAIDDSLMLARIGRALVNDFTDIAAVVKQLVEIPLVDELAPLAADILVSKRTRRGAYRRSDMNAAGVITGPIDWSRLGPF